MVGTKLKPQLFNKFSSLIVYIVLASVFFSTILISNCSKKSEDIKEKPELLIYCGITMIRPISEIARIVETQEDCKITITKGGSGNLLKSILHNQTGDLYLPGSNRYHKTIDEKHKGLITDRVFVGHNKVVIMVQKDNPKAITSDLINLTNKEYGVIIGNPESGSIGKETKKILEKRGIFEEVINNTISLTTDSKDLLKAIKNKEADIVINWFATSTWGDNAKYIDVIHIDEKYSKTKELVLGLLKFSKYPDISKKIMDFAGSEKGKEIFKKHGLYFE